MLVGHVDPLQVQIDVLVAGHVFRPRNSSFVDWDVHTLVVELVGVVEVRLRNQSARNSGFTLNQRGLRVVFFRVPCTQRLLHVGVGDDGRTVGRVVGTALQLIVGNRLHVDLNILKERTQLVSHK